MKGVVLPPDNGLSSSYAHACSLYSPQTCSNALLTHSLLASSCSLSSSERGSLPDEKDECCTLGSSPSFAPPSALGVHPSPLPVYSTSLGTFDTLPVFSTYPSPRFSPAPRHPLLFSTHTPSVAFPYASGKSKISRGVLRGRRWEGRRYFWAISGREGQGLELKEREEVGTEWA